MKKGYVQVTDSYERIVHWMLAISCLLLCITGLGMMFQIFNFFGALVGGLKNLKLVHNFTGSGFCRFAHFSRSGCGGRKPGFLFSRKIWTGSRRQAVICGMWIKFRRRVNTIPARRCSS